MENIWLKELKSIDTRKVASHFGSAFRKDDEKNTIQIKSIIAAFVSYKMQNDDELDSIDAICNEIGNDKRISEIIRSYDADYINIAKSSINIFTSYELLAFILFDDSLDNETRRNETTPFGIIKLANKILDIKDDDNVLELCSGKGNFYIGMSIDDVKAKYIGIELNYIRKDIAEIRSYLVGESYEYILFDALEYKSENKVDKIFANYPFALRGFSIDECKRRLQNSLDLPEEILRRVSSDWLFNLSIIEQLKDNGKAVVVMTNGSTWNESDKNIRRYFIEHGYVETVVSLPEKLFDFTTIPATLMVLSKNNKKVKFVDAKNLFKSGRRQNVLTDKNINTILDAINEDCDISTTANSEKLVENEYNLNAIRFLDTIPEIKNGVKFETLIKNITRGSQIEADLLDKYKSDQITNYQYLLLSNINDGILSIDNESQYLTEIPDNMSRYVIKNNSIILSKIGTPNFKSAVAQIEDGKQIIANGNIFVIEVDKEKANPFYIQAFFMSDLGERMLRNICAGTTLLTINLEKLNNMTIPNVSLEKQNEIANKYEASIDELILLNRKTEKIKQKMKTIFDEGDINC